jgi:hypothetical protein
MTNDRFYEHRHFSNKKRKNNLKKNASIYSYQRDYSLGDFLSDVGNQEIASFFESILGIQAKLNVSKPGDVYEQEADKIAHDIVNNKTSKKPKISRMRSRSNVKNKSVNSNLESKIKGLKGKGNPLNKSLRKYFESRFDVPLDNVKIHTGNPLNELAYSLNAKAFTHGNDIVFGEGQYQPETTSGKELIAHELVHTQQQGEGIQTDVVQREDIKGQSLNKVVSIEVGNHLNDKEEKDRGIWVVLRLVLMIEILNYLMIYQRQKI